MIKNSFLSHFWQGYSVVSYAINAAPKSIELLLTPNKDNIPRCGHCFKHCQSIHDSSERIIRDCNILEYQTFLRVPIRRVNCPDCGHRVESIDWLNRYSRLTNRLVEYIESLCKVLPVSHIARFVELHWETIKNIDKHRLNRDIKPDDFSNVTRLVMDEFAIRKGHRYATVIADAKTMKVLWVGEGNKRESIRPFFEKLGEFRDNIKAVAMDMNTSFDLEVKYQCKNAEVVYDLFHVVAKYGREVIDRVRVDRANELKEDKKARKVVKRGRWLLLKNRVNLTGEQESKLNDLLSANQPLSTVYILKEQLKEIWRAKTVWSAYKCWRRWFNQVNESDIKSLKEFARKLKPYFRGIVSAAKFPLNTSCLEGINNKIKVIKRMAYGFRDNEYFFLKIKAAFPGKP